MLQYLQVWYIIYRLLFAHLGDVEELWLQNVTICFCAFWLIDTDIDWEYIDISPLHLILMDECLQNLASYEESG